MEDARAFVPCATLRPGLSVLTGHVPVIEKPELTIAESMVSQPEEVFPLLSESPCLYA